VFCVTLTGFPIYENILAFMAVNHYYAKLRSLKLAKFEAVVSEPWRSTECVTFKNAYQLPSEETVMFCNSIVPLFKL
jgi:hypothetical protein